MVAVNGSASVGGVVYNVTANVTLPTVTPPAPTGYPDATTTGHRGTLTNSTNSRISAPGIYQNLNFTNGLELWGAGITIRNCKISGSGWAVVNARNSSGAIIEDCTIDGLKQGEGSHGVLGGGFARVSRCNIYGVENGVTPEGRDQQIIGNYMHDFGSPGAPHYDGIQIDGGHTNILVDNNTIILNEGQTSACMIDNYFGPINGVIVRNNRLIGGGYTVYSSAQFSGGPVNGVQFINNRLGRGYWGYAAITGNSPVWTGNVDDVTGATVNY